MTTAKRRAPDPEWAQMYRQGIPSPMIAAGAGVAESTVQYHPRLAVQSDPGLRAAHQAALRAVTRTTSAGKRNLNDVVSFYEAVGRLPRPARRHPRERASGVWLHRRRQEAAAGALSLVYLETLDATISCWAEASSQKADKEASGPAG
jgi:hypothetical protein